MDTYMHKTMASVANLEKIEIIRSQELMQSKARLKFLKKMIILGPKTAILGPQFCRILVLGPHFLWSGGPNFSIFSQKFDFSVVTVVRLWLSGISSCQDTAERLEMICAVHGQLVMSVL